MLHRARGIRRRAQDDGAGPLREDCPHGRGVDAPAVLRARGDEDRRAAADADEVRVAGIVRRGHDDLVAGRDQQREHQQHGRRRAVGDEDAARIDACAGPLPVVFGDGFAQREQAAAVGVPRLAFGEGAPAGLDGLGRRREVGLADLEMHHVRAGRLELDGALEHLHREERLDSLDASGEPEGHRGLLPVRCGCVKAPAAASGWNQNIYRVRDFDASRPG